MVSKADLAAAKAVLNTAPSNFAHIRQEQRRITEFFREWEKIKGIVLQYVREEFEKVFPKHYASFILVERENEPPQLVLMTVMTLSGPWETEVDQDGIMTYEGSYRMVDKGFWVRVCQGHEYFEGKLSRAKWPVPKHKLMAFFERMEKAMNVKAEIHEAPVQSEKALQEHRERYRRSLHLEEHEDL